MGSGGSGVVNYGGITLDPDPATILGQESVVLRAGLAFVQNWSKRNEFKYT